MATESSAVPPESNGSSPAQEDFDLTLQECEYISRSGLIQDGRARDAFRRSCNELANGSQHHEQTTTSRFWDQFPIPFRCHLGARPIGVLLRGKIPVAMLCKAWDTNFRKDGKLYRTENNKFKDSYQIYDHKDKLWRYVYSDRLEQWMIPHPDHAPMVMLDGRQQLLTVSNVMRFPTAVLDMMGRIGLPKENLPPKSDFEKTDEAERFSANHIPSGHEFFQSQTTNDNATVITDGSDRNRDRADNFKSSTCGPRHAAPIVPDGIRIKTENDEQDLHQHSEYVNRDNVQRDDTQNDNSHVWAGESSTTHAKKTSTPGSEQQSHALHDQTEYPQDHPEQRHPSSRSNRLSTKIDHLTNEVASMKKLLGRLRPPQQIPNDTDFLASHNPMFAASLDTDYLSSSNNHSKKRSAPTSVSDLQALEDSIHAHAKRTKLQAEYDQKCNVYITQLVAHIFGEGGKSPGHGKNEEESEIEKVRIDGMKHELEGLKKQLDG